MRIDALEVQINGVGENQSGEERLKDNSPLIIHVCDIAKATIELQFAVNSPKILPGQILVGLPRLRVDPS